MSKNELNEHYTNSSDNAFTNLIIGLALSGIGIFLIMQNTTLVTNFSLMDILGFTPPFGLVLLPLLFGIGVLFYNSKSILGWVLLIFGIVTILLGILMGLRIIFRPVSLYQGVLMYGMTAAGAGLILKALSPKRN
ncbi:hypothetical protein [Natronospora cellulosivora (SeqCode)]